MLQEKRAVEDAIKLQEQVLPLPVHTRPPLCVDDEFVLFRIAPHR